MNNLAGYRIIMTNVKEIIVKRKKNKPEIQSAQRIPIVAIHVHNVPIMDNHLHLYIIGLMEIEAKTEALGNDRK